MGELEESRRLFLNYQALKKLDPKNKILRYFPQNKELIRGKERIIIRPDTRSLIKKLGIFPKQNTSQDTLKYCADILQEEYLIVEQRRREEMLDGKIHKLLELEPESPIEEFCEFNQEGYVEKILEIGKRNQPNVYEYLEISGASIPPLEDHFGRTKFLEEEFLEAVSWLLDTAKLRKKQ